MWDQQVESGIMERASRHATRQAGANVKRVARGAAGSFYVTLQIVGWRALSHTVVVTRGGTALNLSRGAPRTVMRHLRSGWELTLASKATHPIFTAEAQT